MWLSTHATSGAHTYKSWNFLYRTWFSSHDSVKVALIHKLASDRKMSIKMSFIVSKCQVSLGVYSNLITDVCVCLQSKSAIMAQEPSLGSIKSSFFEVFFGEDLAGNSSGGKYSNNSVRPKADAALKSHTKPKRLYSRFRMLEQLGSRPPPRREWVSERSEVEKKGALSCPAVRLKACFDIIWLDGKTTGI